MSVCSTCHGGCCRRFNIHLTGYDILSISKKLNLQYMDFIRIFAIDEEKIEKVAKLSPLFKFPDLGDGFFAFYLKKVKSRRMPGDRCMFMLEWNDEDFMLPDKGNITARCGIYSCRPLTCAIYPSKMSDDGLTGLTGDPNKSPNIIKTNTGRPEHVLCPRPILQGDFADYSGEMIKNLVIQRYEIEYFKAIAAIWNKEPDNFNNFFKFIEMAYRDRVLYVEQSDDEE